MRTLAALAAAGLNFGPAAAVSCGESDDGGPGARSGTGGTGGSTGSGGSPDGGVRDGSAFVPHEPAVHRASTAACDDVRPTEEPPPPPDAGGVTLECLSNADCKSGRNGRCRSLPRDGFRCTYDYCTTDAECMGSSTPAKVCACSGGMNTDENVCVDGNCASDADCGDGGYCSPTRGACTNFPGVFGYYCHTPDDECSDDSDCNVDAGEACVHRGDRWACFSQICPG